MAQPCIQSSSRGSRSPAMEQCGGCKQCLNSAMQHPEFLNNRTVPSVSHPFPIRFPSVSHPFPIRFPSVSHPFPTHPMREPSGWTSHLSPFCAHSWPTAPPERFEHSILFHAGTPPKKNDHLEMVSTTRKGDG